MVTDRPNRCAALDNRRSVRRCRATGRRALRIIGMLGLGLYGMWAGLGSIARADGPLDRANSPDATPKGYELEFPAMGSRVALQVYAEHPAIAEQSLQAGRAELERLVAILSDYASDSELAVLHGELAAHGAATAGEDLWQVLAASQHWHEISDGAFDASIGTVTRLWRRARRRRELPTQEMIDQALHHAGWQRVRLDGPTRTVHGSDPELRFDFGGIGAGYIIDRVYERLVATGCPQCLVNISGDIRCGQAPPGRSGWSVQVGELPSVADGPGAAGPIAAADERRPQILELTGCSVTTSGDLWQYTEIDGVRRSHIVDPRTGIGVPGPSSVTVIAERCLDADAGATAISVMGPEAGLAAAKRWPGLEAQILWRDSSGVLHSDRTAGFPEPSVDHHVEEAIER